MPSSTADLLRRQTTPYLAAGVAAGVLVVAMLLMGRHVWCECRVPRLFVANPGTSHSSQHIADWYSVSHLLHGVVFYFAFLSIRSRFGNGWHLAAAIALEVAWEIFENTPFVINRYREATAAFGYSGDSIVNAVGDVAFCLLGFVVAAKIGWRWSIALFVAAEVVMILAIRDSLLLNVLMLVWPLDAIREWQGAGISGG